MADINKEKFLTELGKLLTFMYEEDRQYALSLYSRMFDQAEDEMALIHLLSSPTRQAVIVARAYNAKEHKLDVYSHSRETAVTADSGEMPDYVRAIQQIQETAVSQRVIAADVADGQFSLFADDGYELTEPYGYGDIPADPVEAVPVREAEPVILAPVPVEPEEPVLPMEAAEPVEPMAEPAPLPQEIEVAEEPAPEEPPVEEMPAPVPVEPEAPALSEEPQASEPAAVILMGDEDLTEEPLSEELVPTAPEEELIPAEPAVPVAPEEPEALEEPAPVIEVLDVEEELPPAPTGTVRKPKTFLLLLYILVFAPLTVLGILLLLIPTLLSLSLAVSVIAAGSMALVAAFSGFAVLADIMVVLGIALIILALGLLFLWLFIWFIGGAIVGLVRGVFSLGGKWCYKEVPAV